MGKLAIAFLFTILMSICAHAQYGAVLTGTAGSGRAAIEPTESPFLNPAAIAFSPGYFFTSDYSTIYKGQAFSVGLTDHLPETVVPTSLIYTQANGDSLQSKGFVTQDLRLAFANFASPRTSVGVGIEHKVDAVNDRKYAQTNMFIGGIYTITGEVGLALVLENLVPADSGGAPAGYRLDPTTAIGVNYNYKRVMRFKADLESSTNNTFSQPAIALGVETHWNRWLIMRLGVRKNSETQIDEYAAGVGFTGPKFAFHYGYINSPQEDKLTRHAVDLAVPIW